MNILNKRSNTLDCYEFPTAFLAVVFVCEAKGKKMFPDLDEYQFAKLFVAVKYEQIAKDLEIKYLDEEITVKTIGSFVGQNQNKLLENFQDKSRWLADEKLYAEIISALHRAKKQGIALESTAEQYADYLRKKLHKHTFVE